MVLYADTSAVVSAYFVDEPDHAVLAALLFDGADPVVTSELTRVELASAVRAAARAGRLADPQVVLDRFDVDCSADEAITRLRLDPQPVLARASALVGQHPLRTLDALHLGVVLISVAELAGADEVCLVTRDDRQGATAAELGLSVR